MLHSREPLITVSLITFWITIRVNRLTRRIGAFSHQALGSSEGSSRKSGDQLHILENRFQLLTQEIVPFDDVPRDKFLCESPMGPKCLVDKHICTCFTNDPGTMVTILLDCSNRNLKVIHAPLPTTTKTLRLEGNNFHKIWFFGWSCRKVGRGSQKSGSNGKRGGDLASRNR